MHPTFVREAARSDAVVSSPGCGDEHRDHGVVEPPQAARLAVDLRASRWYAVEVPNKAAKLTT
jgi:hypothetical protein